MCGCDWLCMVEMFGVLVRVISEFLLMKFFSVLLW